MADWGVYRGMSSLGVCSKCDGFVPAGEGRCPHCGHTHGVPTLAGVASPVVKAAMGVAASMTLMACYGGPDDYIDPGEGDTWSEDGGDEGEPKFDLPNGETCSPSTPIEPLEVYDVTFQDSTLEGSAENQGSCGGEGRERVYAFDAPAGWNFRVTVDSTYGPVLYVRESSACGPELLCSDVLGGQESMVLQGTGETLYIVVDFHDPWVDPEFTLSIETL